MIMRSYYSKSIEQFLKADLEAILGQITSNHKFKLEEQQKIAWTSQIKILKESLNKFPEGYVFFEYVIPRMGKRIDNIVIINGIVFVIEFKVGENQYYSHSIDQVIDYALDLKNFHEKS